MAMRVCLEENAVLNTVSCAHRSPAATCAHISCADSRDIAAAAAIRRGDPSQSPSQSSPAIRGEPLVSTNPKLATQLPCFSASSCQPSFTSHNIQPNNNQPLHSLCWLIDTANRSAGSI